MDIPALLYVSLLKALEPSPNQYLNRKETFPTVYRSLVQQSMNLQWCFPSFSPICSHPLVHTVWQVFQVLIHLFPILFHDFMAIPEFFHLSPHHFGLHFPNPHVPHVPHVPPSPVGSRGASTRLSSQATRWWSWRFPATARPWSASSPPQTASPWRSDDWRTEGLDGWGSCGPALGALGALGLSYLEDILPGWVWSYRSTWMSGTVIYT